MPSVMAARHLCACGRDAIDVVRIASDDGLLLIPVCADCIDVGDADAGEQRELFGRSERRPLTAMPGRGDDPQQPQLPLGDIEVDEEEQGAA